MNKIDQKIVVIGGGTGSFTLLSGLKQYANNITALVNMADDGGSSGLLRDELGVLPPGDIRQCLVALSDASQLRELFNYRFDEGTLKGHSFGNLFLSAVEKMTNNFQDSIDLASKVLRIQGTVLPITTDKSHLVIYDENGTKTKGEFKIGQMDFGKIRRPKIVLEPKAKITLAAEQAILEADVVVIAPGNLYGSLAPALIVDGVSKALVETNATIIYVCNLVTKPLQTDDFFVHDYVSEIERFIGAQVI
ncbi:MAG: YvcK family protein, partial [Candidatus Saccharibacteria bacterium]|nr:YvcK family protein [Candidatus Saccharibacteria bacterium]